MSIYDGIDDIIDSALGLSDIGSRSPHYNYKKSCLRLSQGPPSGVKAYNPKRPRSLRPGPFWIRWGYCSVLNTRPASISRRASFSMSASMRWAQRNHLVRTLKAPLRLRQAAVRLSLVSS